MTKTYDMKEESFKEEYADMERSKSLCHKANQLDPNDKNVRPIIEELLLNKLPQDSSILTPHT